MRVKVKATRNSNDFVFGREYWLDLDDETDLRIFEAYAYRVGEYTQGDFLVILEEEETDGSDDGDGGTDGDD